jgi:uncharacterized membrane protein YphA (DoxX/SURF4 family)
MTETAPDAKRKIASLTIWVLIAAETLMMGAAGASKFFATEMWTGLFTDWGYPVWFAFVVGIAEVMGALLLLFPKLASYAAGFLGVIMLGAVGTLLTHTNDLGLKTPLLHLVVLAIILTARWSRRLR